MSGGMASVRRFYGVPAYRGREVVFSGLERPVRCTILSSTGSHLYLRDSNGRRIGPCHPTWAMDYGDGRDYTAETERPYPPVQRAAERRVVGRVTA